MSQIAQGVFQDLRERRLLPVAGLLVLLLVALPAFMLKKSSAPVVMPPLSGTAATPASADGLPSPEQALSADKPLVSLAVLEDPSSLNTYQSRDPFKPLQKLASDVASGTDTPASDVANAQDAAQKAGESGAAGGGGSGGSSDSSQGGSGGGDTSQQAPSTTPQTTPQTTKPKNEKLTYALDLGFTSPRGERSYRGVAKLKMLPSQSQPLFIYLGIDATGTKAVFLVDSSLTFAGGEGTCSPGSGSCATVALQPGEIAKFKDAQGQAYQLEIDQIREVSASKAAASARKAARAARASAHASTTDGSAPPRRRFMPPVITDLLTGATR